MNINDKRIMMLWPDKGEFLPKEINKQSDKIDVMTLYKPCGLIRRCIRKFCVRFVILLTFFLDDWPNKMNDYDVILIHANELNRKLPKWLVRRGYKNRIIYWYWNPVVACINPRKIDRKFCEIWSFDPKDCENYKMKYNTTYYLSSIKPQKRNIKFDVFFVGQDKGRYKLLQNLKIEMIKQNLTVDFHITKDKTSTAKGEYTNKISYDEVLQRIEESRSILDIVQNQQSGQTLRAMEALFFSKKLITNNLSIMKMEFYHSNNIFLIGVDKIESLKAFLLAPYHKINQEVIQKYDFNQWIKRF